MGVESYLVLWVFTDECCHPNRFRVELMLIESFEIGRLDFPNRDTLESTHCFLPNETQAQPRLRGTQVAASIGTLAKLDMKKQRRLSRWLHRLVRRFHLCSGEKHADSDRALPAGVCLLSISRPPVKGFRIIERRYCHVNPFRTDFVLDKQRRATTRGERA